MKRNPMSTIMRPIVLRQTAIFTVADIANQVPGLGELYSIANVTTSARDALRKMEREGSVQTIHKGGNREPWLFALTALAVTDEQIAEAKRQSVTKHRKHNEDLFTKTVEGRKRTSKAQADKRWLNEATKRREESIDRVLSVSIDAAWEPPATRSRFSHTATPVNVYR